MARSFSDESTCTAMKKHADARPYKENEQMNPICCFSGFTSIAAADDMQFPVVQRDSEPGKMREGRVGDTGIRGITDILFVCLIYFCSCCWWCCFQVFFVVVVAD